jgi:hypothetical protein
VTQINLKKSIVKCNTCNRISTSTPYSSHNQTLVALSYSIFIIVLYREGLPSWYVWTLALTIALFVLTLVLEPQYVILLALVILIVYFKSRLGDRNILLSSILLLGFVLSVSYVFQNVFKQHHRDRFNILLGKTVDLKGMDIIRINLKLLSDRRMARKGFLEGTQTKEDLYRNNILITSLPPLVKNGALESSSSHHFIYYLIS